MYIYIYIYIYVYTYIYYYTPLPLNLANKQQASNKHASKQALLLSVLTIAPPHRSGLYSTLAILEPLPLNLANKQQASNQQASKQALLLSVLAIAAPHRSGLYSTLAILEPRWCPCQIQVLSQKLTGGAPGRGRQVWRCPSKTAHFVPQNSLFWPQTAPKLSQNGQTKQNGGCTLRAA